jgi:enoyl-[acyl-carrier protein] reductase III
MNPFDMAGKVVLVTGGTRGLGRSVSLCLARAGATVHAGYFGNEAAAAQFRDEAESSGLACFPVKANLMTSQGVQALCSHVSGHSGRLDCLVHCAATGVHKPLVDLTQRHLATVWQVNVGAFFDLACQLLPLMPEGGRIVAVSSEGARRAIDQYGAVGSSKGALEALCRQMAVEWAPRGVNVNMVVPGLLATDTLAALPDAANRVRNEEQSSPLRRLVTLEEVAWAVQFLCSRAAAALVGQAIVVDGGKSVSSLC